MMLWKTLSGGWLISHIFLSPEGRCGGMYTYATWKRDRLSPYLEYYACISLTMLGVLYNTEQWSLFLVSLAAVLTLGVVGYLILCYKWLVVHKWGIEYHSGAYKCSLDFGTFEVYRYSTKFGYTYELRDTARGGLYAHFWAPNDFTGIQAFERACKRNRVRMWLIERR